jgi:hypothetical protein
MWRPAALVDSGEPASQRSGSDFEDLEQRVFRFAVALMALAVAACSPAAEEPAVTGADAVTPRNPFFGTWEIKGARIAPWWNGQGEEPAADPAYTKLSLEAAATSGAPVLTCDKPSYMTDIKPLRGLFEGLLPEPEKDAAALGLTETNPTVLTFSCASGTADVEAQFVMADPDTILLGIDNVIYTYTRTGG